MGLFAQFEVEVIDVLIGGALSSDQMTLLKQGGSKSTCEFTGYGYFLTVTHARFPIDQVVCSQPMVTGTAGRTLSISEICLPAFRNLTTTASSACD